jgi:SAM-dependent methyltransferase
MTMHREGWRAATGLVALIVLQSLAATPALPQQNGDATFHVEIKKQESIYQSKGTQVPDGYVTYRALKDYEDLLPSGFGKALGELGPGDRWLDVGAGRGQAILDYYDREFPAPQGASAVQPRGKARAVAVSIEDRRTDQWRERSARLGGDHIKYLSSKPLRDYSSDELGKFRIITDVFGGFSYTDNLSLFIEKILGALEVNGSFYSLLQSVRLEDGKEDANTWWLTEIKDRAGQDVKVCSWLKSISCVKVTCESKSAWDTPTELIRVQKVCNEFSVPKVTRVQYEAGNPPGRVFQLAW